MAKLCEKCFHCSVCGSAKDVKVANLIDSVGCMQFTREDRVIVLPSSIKPGTKVDLKVDDQMIPYFIDKVVVYRNGGVDIYCQSEKGQGTYVCNPEDLGKEIFFKTQD